MVLVPIDSIQNVSLLLHYSIHPPRGPDHAVLVVYTFDPELRKLGLY